MGTRKEKKRRNKKHERRVRTKLKEKNGNIKDKWNKHALSAGRVLRGLGCRVLVRSYGIMII